MSGRALSHHGALLGRTAATIVPQDEAARGQARARLERPRLAMPFWALGRLMDLAVELAGMTGSQRPSLRRRAVVVMAGDHGVAVERVSECPQEVTQQVVRKFLHGTASINLLAGLSGARVVVVDVGVAADLTDLVPRGLIDKKICFGTRNLRVGPAMTRAQAVAAVEAGIEVVESLAPHVDLFATGEMGKCNTTPSSAIVAVMTGAPVAQVTGRGAGLDDEGLARKIRVIGDAIQTNRPDPSDGLDVLSKVGGLELAGVVGLILGAAAHRRPILVDGLISTAAALVANALVPRSRQYMIFAHCGAEPGHRRALEHLHGEGLLQGLGLRLGEGTGAVLAMHLVDAAACILSEIEILDEAHVTR